MTSLSSRSACVGTGRATASPASLSPLLNLKLAPCSRRHGSRDSSLFYQARVSVESSSSRFLTARAVNLAESSAADHSAADPETLEASEATRPDPLLDALTCNAKSDVASFHFPAHRRGLGAPPRALSAFGADVFRHDLPELPDLDNLFAPESVIAEAQERAARVFGASKTHFLVNGSTVGVQAAIIACCRPGDVLILPRNAHQCAFSGMVLSGAVPHYVLPEADLSWGITHGVTLDSVTAAVQQVSATGARIGAVLVVSPTYYGVCSDIRGIARACHHAGVALIVDEAHGAHFKFQDALPETALECGADMVVQSTHKVLGSLTQSAMLHIAHGHEGLKHDIANHSSHEGENTTAAAAAASPGVNACDVSRALQLLQSSSPSYLLLASLDATLGHVSLPTFSSALSRAILLASHLRSSLQSMGLRVLHPGAHAHMTPVHSHANATVTSEAARDSEGHGMARAFDPLRVTVSVREVGITGYDMDDVLRLQHGVIAELPFLHGIMFALSVGTTHRDVDRVIAAFAAVVADKGVGGGAGDAVAGEAEQGLGDAPFFSSLNCTSAPLPPRDAFFAASEVVPAQQAVGRYSADMLCPYPPGIPVLLPGELVTAEALTFLQRVLSLGGSVSGFPADTLDAVRVIVGPV